MDSPKKTYFQKSLIATRLYGIRVPISWEPAGDGDGVIATADKAVIDALRAKAAARVGGVKEISKEEYEAKKAEPVPPKRHVTQDPAFLQPRIGNNVLPRSSSTGKQKSRAAEAGDRPAFPNAEGPSVGKRVTGADSDAEPA